eukprot:4587706-Amphidinium_carterae.1
MRLAGTLYYALQAAAAGLDRTYWASDGWQVFGPLLPVLKVGSVEVAHALQKSPRPCAPKGFEIVGVLGVLIAIAGLISVANLVSAAKDGQIKASI